MGGLGSGDWLRYDRKPTVEESLTVSIDDFRGRLSPGSTGTFTWTWPSGDNSSVGYTVTWDEDETIVTLRYSQPGGEPVRIPIYLQSSPTNFGGRRWWFTCPLVVNGVACRRRVGKVHLPPGARHFGCRQCHDLTYRSSQEAHRSERFLAGVGLRDGRSYPCGSGEGVERIVSGWYGCGWKSATHWRTNVICPMEQCARSTRICLRGLWLKTPICVDDFIRAREVASQGVLLGNRVIADAQNHSAKTDGLPGTLRQFWEFLDANRGAIDRIGDQLALISDPPFEFGGLTDVTAHHLAWQFVHGLWIDARQALFDSTIQESESQGGDTIAEIDDISAGESFWLAPDRVCQHLPAIRERLAVNEPVDSWRISYVIRSESQKALDRWSAGQATGGDGTDDSPKGYFGGAELAAVLGIHPSRRGAFLKQLERKRPKLHDYYREIRDRKGNDSHYTYRADAPIIQKLAAKYQAPVDG